MQCDQGHLGASRAARGPTYPWHHRRVLLFGLRVDCILGGRKGAAASLQRLVRSQHVRTQHRLQLVCTQHRSQHAWRDCSTLACNSTADALSNKKKFPTFLRTVPAKSSYKLGIIGLMKWAGWLKINVLYEEAISFSGLAKA